MDVNLNSSDAWFARLDQRMTQQDAILARIESQVEKTNGRVNKHDAIINNYKGRITMFVLAISAAASVVFYAIEAGIRLTLAK